MFCTRVPLVSQLQFPINELVWNIHSNTNSTDFSHFWSNLGWQPVCKFLPNTRCDDVISINRSINSIIDYFNNWLIDFNRLIVAALLVTIVLNCRPFEPMQLNLLIWKWPGYLDFFASILLFHQLMSSKGPINRYKCLMKYLIFLYHRLSATLYMPQIRFRPGLRPGPHWGSWRRSPRHPSRLGRVITPPHSQTPWRSISAPPGHTTGESTKKSYQTNSWFWKVQLQWQTTEMWVANIEI